jgi:predicted nucleic acid-binding protein
LSYLLDTNVLSEAVRPRPNAGLLAWLAEIPESSLHLSVLTLGELRSGVEALADGTKKEKLRVWLEQDLPLRFGERLLDVDAAVADRWGRLVGQAGRPLAAIDSLLAATALARGLRMVTRNVDDFRFPGLEVVMPWR